MPIEHGRNGFDEQIFGADKQVPGRWQSDQLERSVLQRCRAGRAEPTSHSALLNLPYPLPWPSMAGAFSISRCCKVSVN
jgi:hypothetical protein